MEGDRVQRELFGIKPLDTFRCSTISRKFCDKWYFESYSIISRDQNRSTEHVNTRRFA